MTFYLYQQQQGGSPLWMETQNVQPDKNGHYSVMLGSTTSQGLPTSVFASGDARWLGVQAQGYAEQARVMLLAVPYALKAVDMETGKEGAIPVYPTPDELWSLTFAKVNACRDRFAGVPFEDKGGSHPSRYYQDIAVERVMEAIAANRQRILLTLATGTGPQEEVLGYQ